MKSPKMEKRIREGSIKTHSELKLLATKNSQDTTRCISKTRDQLCSFQLLMALGYCVPTDNSRPKLSFLC